MRGQVATRIVPTKQLSCLCPFDPSFNSVRGLAVGRLWKGDSSPSSLKKCPSAAPKGLAGSHSLKALLTSLVLGSQSLQGPHPTCLPQWGLVCCASWWFGCTAKEMGHFPGDSPSCHQPALSFSCLGFLGLLSVGGGRSLFSLSHPSIKVTLAKGVFPYLDRSSSHPSQHSAHSPSGKASP